MGAQWHSGAESSLIQRAPLFGTELLSNTEEGVAGGGSRVCPLTSGCQRNKMVRGTQPQTHGHVVKGSAAKDFCPWGRVPKAKEGGAQSWVRGPWGPACRCAARLIRGRCHKGTSWKQKHSNAYFCCVRRGPLEQWQALALWSHTRRHFSQPAIAARMHPAHNQAPSMHAFTRAPMGKPCSV